MSASFIRLTSGTGHELWLDKAQVSAVLHWSPGTGVTTTEVFVSGGFTFWVKETVEEVIEKLRKER